MRDLSNLIRPWMGALLARQAPRMSRRRPQGTVDVMVCVADHFEPEWRGADPDRQRARVRAWCERFPEPASRHRDADGGPPRWTFFYPIEAYDRGHVAALGRLCRQGYGEVEVQLHHDGDTQAGLRRMLVTGVKRLSDDGLLGVNRETGCAGFAFVHGNWALANSRPDGRWCGVNGELRVLAEAGCYADFTFPSAPHPTQPRRVNSIYYAGEDGRPRPHDRGAPVRVGGEATGDLMLVQGPLALTWDPRRRRPRLEAADLRATDPPHPDRVDAWVRAGIGVVGRPEWVFVKVHTHGAQEANLEMLLGEAGERFLTHLERAYNDGARYRLHYVTARELFNIVKAAEAGHAGNAGAYRDFLIRPPGES